MKLNRFVAAMTALPLAITLNMHAAPAQEGEVDFGTFAPPDNGGEFVEVNVPSNLISLAARFVEKQEPDIAKLLNGLKQIRVNVVGLNTANLGDMEQRAQRLRTDLGNKGWERVVTVRNAGQDVGVYLKMNAQSAIQGLTVVVIEGKKQAVFANIVGEIKPEQISMVAERFQIEPLKHLPQAPEKTEK